VEIVLLDEFIVPEESRVEFLEQAQHAQRVVRTIPGYVEGHIYERKNGESPYNFLTAAVWESEDAVENARRIVAREYEKQGFNPAEILQGLRIDRRRSIYQRTPY
jgi:heme-degrading monooxygenase HmoA